MTENDELDDQVESAVEAALDRLASELAEEECDADDDMTEPEYDRWFAAVLDAFARVYRGVPTND